ncbi:uncharacterized protein LOC133298330 [Gastrolobium bilobum]|uniref:uncharacterized protein LOC133298330 n=1 Tax=Gastrolobium bilobum TaxID=150636 RepID=UPI002AAFEE74|nr:uncharacterized protein LOC133298330 [Gastrolobium bilobum]
MNYDVLLFQWLNLPTQNAKELLFMEDIFTTAKQYSTFKKKYATEKIIEPKYLDIKFWDAEGFEICDLLSSNHLLQMSILKEKYVENLIRAFYCTMSFENNTPKDEIKGKSIIVLPTEWPNLIGCPYVGRTDPDVYPEFDRSAFI